MKILILMTIIIVVLFVPIGTFWVDSEYILGVKDMREIYPEANYEGQVFDTGHVKFTLSKISNRQTERLTIIGYGLAYLHGAVHERLKSDKEK